MPKCSDGDHLYGRTNHCIFCLAPRPAETLIDPMPVPLIWSGSDPYDSVAYAFYAGFAFGAVIALGVYSLIRYIHTLPV